MVLLTASHFYFHVLSIEVSQQIIFSANQMREGGGDLCRFIVILLIVNGRICVSPGL
jgi:hypothetical protein